MCKKCGHVPGKPTRRTLLGAVGAGAASAVAGCLGGTESGQGEPPDPIALSGGQQCDVCGMVIGQHAGPNGQIFYAEHSPEAHENPARFDSLKACLFPYHFQHERRDWEPLAIYATDYSAVEYTVSTRDGTKYVSSHTAPDTFANAKDLQYVVESDVRGAMGADFLPFSDQEDAESFAEAHGGRTVTFDEITPGLVGK